MRLANRTPHKCQSNGPLVGVDLANRAKCPLHLACYRSAVWPAVHKTAAGAGPGLGERAAADSASRGAIGSGAVRAGLALTPRGDSAGIRRGRCVGFLRHGIPAHRPRRFGYRSFSRPGRVGSAFVALHSAQSKGIAK
jgi:hypothetical protein